MRTFHIDLISRIVEDAVRIALREHTSDRVVTLVVSEYLFNHVPSDSPVWAYIYDTATQYADGLLGVK